MAEADWKYLQYNVENGQKRTSDGPSGGASSLSDLDDTNISNPSDGQMLGYDETEGKWINVNAPAGSVTDVTLDGNTVVNGQGVAALTTPNVNDLKDTSISNLSNGQTLQYNETNHKWENVTPSGGGGNVDDVKVNGTSVVTNKVANITSYKEVTQAQYEALPDTKLSDGVLYAIKDGGQAVDGFPPLIYSDEEREIGVWRDGKPLYQKTISLGALSYDTSWHYVAHGITNIDKVIQIYGAAKSNDGLYVTMPNMRPGQTSGIMLCANNTNVAYICNWISGQDWAYATLQYTKTTDTPGSGIWTPSGATAHHYSTTEQVIGTWIDGKPVYEIVKPITTTSGNYNFDVSSLNIDFLVDLRIQIKNVNGGAYCNGTYWQASNDYFNYYLQSSKHIITFRSGSGYAYGTGHVILQYTKTTD